VTGNSMVCDLLQLCG